MRKFALLFIFSFLSLNIPAFAQQQFSIATLNTWMIPVLRKKANIRASVIGEALKKYDGAFLQEVFNNKQKKIFKKKLQGFNSHEDSRPLGKLTSGLLSFSRYPIIRKEFLRYKDCKLAQCFANKGVILTRVKISEDVAVDIYNTHTEPFSDRSEIRKKQFEQLIDFMFVNDPLRMNPTVILGDLNIHSETDEYDLLNSRLGRFGFRDSWVELNGGLPGFTWNSFENEWGQILERKPDERSKERLDYIYVRDGAISRIELDEVELIFNERIKLKPSDSEQHFLSDHYGVGATMTFY